MTERDPSDWMWQQATDFIQRADKSSRKFFQLHQTAMRACWEPPIDIFETDHELVIVVALPGVEDRHVDVSADRGEIVVLAHRVLPEEFATGSVRRLEIPQGRFERRIALPVGSYEAVERKLANGCLLLRLRKVVGS